MTLFAPTLMPQATRPRPSLSPLSLLLLVVVEKGWRGKGATIVSRDTGVVVSSFFSLSLLVVVSWWRRCRATMGSVQSDSTCRRIRRLLAGSRSLSLAFSLSLPLSLSRRSRGAAVEKNRERPPFLSVKRRRELSPFLVPPLFLFFS